MMIGKDFEGSETSYGIAVVSAEILTKHLQRTCLEHHLCIYPFSLIVMQELFSVTSLTDQTLWHKYGARTYFDDLRFVIVKCWYLGPLLFL
jgi:hypothetical protein